MALATWSRGRSQNAVTRHPLGVETSMLPRHPEPSSCKGARLAREVAVATLIQDKQHGNEDRHQRWTRIERADLFAQYDDLHAQGVSQRQAAKVLDVPRSTLQAWRMYQDRLDACPTVVTRLHRIK